MIVVLICLSFLSAYHLTWVSLTLYIGYFFIAAQAKCSCCFLPWTWGSSFWPLPRPWKWDSSSRAPPLTLDVGSSSRPRSYVVIAATLLYVAASVPPCCFASPNKLKLCGVLVHIEPFILTGTNLSLIVVMYWDLVACEQ